MIGLIGFLDRDGILEELLWSNPTYLISPLGKIADILENGQDLIPMLRLSKASNHIHIEFGMLRYKESLLPVKIVVQVVREQILLFLYDANKERAEEMIEGVLPALISLHRGSPEHKAFEYEQMQMLNSQLINSQRELAKKNALISQLSKRYEELAKRDPLTHLYNRYHYMEEIQQLIQRKADEKGIFLFIDIDDFKMVNDEYGHLFGDEYLREFAKRLTKLSIPDSVCFRIAGDEFGLYIHGNTYAGIAQFTPIWEQIQRIILHDPVEFNQTKMLISISMGIAIYAEKGMEISQLVMNADSAMYLAKGRGKNQYVFFEE